MTSGLFCGGGGCDDVMTSDDAWTTLPAMTSLGCGGSPAPAPVDDVTTAAAATWAGTSLAFNDGLILSSDKIQINNSINTFCCDIN